ncbi:hypothetical protein HYV81_00030 [Candidatus Woesearchaeota archaeon]|nr:hypothetical protein [Candidatus Woesearchaeota archaeon]
MAARDWIQNYFNKEQAAARAEEARRKREDLTLGRKRVQEGKGCSGFKYDWEGNCCYG